MKICTKLSLLLLLVCAFAAASCGKDDLDTGITPAVPPFEKGFLSFEGWNLSVADDMETIPSDLLPSGVVRAMTEASGDYLIKILNSKNEEIGSYTYAAIKTIDSLELPQDSYTITAQSPNYAATPTAEWNAPVYYGKVKVSVIRQLTATVSNLVCRLSNIKTTVELSADLNSLFKPDDAEQKLTTTLSIADNALTFSRTETRAGFFLSNNEDNTLKIVLTGLYNKAGESQPASYVPVTWSQEIKNIQAGQWRKIDINVLNANDGNIQFEVAIETWVYDQKIDVDIMSSLYTYGEEEIPDEDPSDENAPVVTLENNHDLTQPFLITSSIFDFDVQSCSDMISAVITPQEGSTVASLQVVFDSDNAQLLTALTTAGYTNNTIALWPGENPAKNYCVVKTSDSKLLVKVNYNGMKGLYGYAGTHTARFIATDSKGRCSYTTMTMEITNDIIPSEGPSIVWNDGAGGSVDFDIRHTIPEGGELPVIIDFISSAGITGLLVGINSEMLTTDILEELGLAAEMDLVNPATDEMNEALRSLGFKTKDEVVGAMSLSFDISQFMPLLWMVAPGNTDFRLTVTDASGTTVKTIMLNVPQP